MTFLAKGDVRPGLKKCVFLFSQNFPIGVAINLKARHFPIGKLLLAFRENFLYGKPSQEI